MQLKTADSASAVLAPKVQGTVILDALLREEPLSFLVLCSSINSIYGVPGAVDYTSANAFLDAFAASRYTGSRAPVTSIDWDTWQEVGMAVNTTVPRDLLAQRRATLAAGIRPAEGIEAFWRVLASGLPQVAVITRDLPHMLETVEQAAAGLPENAAAQAADPGEMAPQGHARPELASDYTPPETETQRRIVEIWNDLFGLEEIGIDDNFFELGGHSLLATGVLARIATSLWPHRPVALHL